LARLRGAQYTPHTNERERFSMFETHCPMVQVLE
jgi:hypothetical protein